MLVQPLWALKLRPARTWECWHCVTREPLQLGIGTLKDGKCGKLGGPGRRLSRPGTWPGHVQGQNSMCKQHQSLSVDGRLEVSKHTCPSSRMMFCFANVNTRGRCTAEHLRAQSWFGEFAAVLSRQNIQVLACSHQRVLSEK